MEPAEITALIGEIPDHKVHSAGSLPLITHALADTDELTTESVYKALLPYADVLDNADMMTLMWQVRFSAILKAAGDGEKRDIVYTAADVDTEHINGLLRNGGYSLEDGGNDIVTVSGCLGGAEESGTGPRNATVIYAGGDDLFIVGAWRDIIEFAVDLHRSLEEFSCGTLSISAGIGLFDEKYPISYIASQTGDLEDASKSMEGKNAVTLFSEKEQTYHWEGFIDEGNLSTSHRKPSLRQTYHWDEFIDEVLGEKFRLLYKFFSFSSETAERGKAFLYHILDLFRKADEKINLARLAYLLARLEPSKKKGDENAEAYRRLYQEFKQHLYDWQRDEKDRRQFITAIYIYAYLDRESYTD